MKSAPARGVLDQALLHIGDADARDPGRGAFEIVRLLAIELQEGAGNAPAPRPRVATRTERIGDAHLDAAIAADKDVVAGLDADDAEILDRRLGAIARAARHRELDLVRRPRAPAASSPA